MDRLRMGPTVLYDVLIREAEERFDRLVDEQGEQGVPATRPRSHPSQSSRRFP